MAFCGEDFLHSLFPNIPSDYNKYLLQIDCEIPVSASSGSGAGCEAKLINMIAIQL